MPYYLRDLTSVEVALIARINSVQRIHLLTQGMLSAKGHVVAYQVEPKIAATLPLLAQQLGIVLLKRRTARGLLRAYSVRRQRVQNALLGLVYGPNEDALVPDEAAYGAYRGLPCWLSASAHQQLHLRDPKGAEMYGLFSGPNRAADGVKDRCAGRYYLHGYAPNRFYADVVVSWPRLLQLPDNGPMPQLPTIYVEENDPDQDESPPEDRGPASGQVAASEVGGDENGLSDNEDVDDGNDGSQTDVLNAQGGDGGQEEDAADESGADMPTISGVVCASEPREVEREIFAKVCALVGGEAAARAAMQAGQVGVAGWAPLAGERLKEMATEGFFTMLAPQIFVEGSCDITIKTCRVPKLNDWLEHIYWAGDGRVAASPLLKFGLLNLKLRTDALSQGRYLVAQQLTDAHLGIAGLAANLAQDDTSVPRKILQHGGQLVNTDPFWKERKRELDALHVWRKYDFGDLPPYFHTLSMAELHWLEIERVLCLYLRTSRPGPAGVEAAERLQSEGAFKRQTLLECGHVVTNLFDARTVNYYATVAKELFQVDDVWWRYEFAKSRGAIHAHALLSSYLHSCRLRAAMEEGIATGEQELAEALRSHRPTLAGGIVVPDAEDVQALSDFRADLCRWHQARLVARVLQDAEQLNEEWATHSSTSGARIPIPFPDGTGGADAAHSEDDEPHTGNEQDVHGAQASEGGRDLAGTSSALTRRIVLPGFVSLHPTGCCGCPPGCAIPCFPCDSMDFEESMPQCDCCGGRRGSCGCKDEWASPEEQGPDPPSACLRRNLRELCASMVVFANEADRELERRRVSKDLKAATVDPRASAAPLDHSEGAAVGEEAADASQPDLRCTGIGALLTHYRQLVQRTMIHKCSGYCLRACTCSRAMKHLAREHPDARPDASTALGRARAALDRSLWKCRFGFGYTVTKAERIAKGRAQKADGDLAHSNPNHPKFPRSWTDLSAGDTTKFEGSWDHPRLVQHVRVALLAWQGNADTQPLLDNSLLGVQRYVCAYSCKGAASTDEYIEVYRKLLANASEDASVRQLAQQLLLKIVGMVDVPAAAADLILSGGKLYRCSRRFTRIGLSGFRALRDEPGQDGTVTCRTPLDRYLEKSVGGGPSLWEWATVCQNDPQCSCGRRHVPVFTGKPQYATWPLSEDFALGQLIVHAPGGWKRTQDLLKPAELGLVRAVHGRDAAGNAQINDVVTPT